MIKIVQIFYCGNKRFPFQFCMELSWKTSAIFTNVCVKEIVEHAALEMSAPFQSVSCRFPSHCRLAKSLLVLGRLLFVTIPHIQTFGTEALGKPPTRFCFFEFFGYGPGLSWRRYHPPRLCWRCVGAGSCGGWSEAVKVCRRAVPSDWSRCLKHQCEGPGSWQKHLLLFFVSGYGLGLCWRRYPLPCLILRCVGSGGAMWDTYNSVHNMTFYLKRIYLVETEWILSRYKIQLNFTLLLTF